MTSLVCVDLHTELQTLAHVLVHVLFVRTLEQITHQCVFVWTIWPTYATPILARLQKQIVEVDGFFMGLSQARFDRSGFFKANTDNTTVLLDISCREVILCADV